MNIKNYSLDELKDLSLNIRDRILNVVSKKGGHLSSSLGATDIIVAMHFVFNPEKDPFIYDVSHQAYAHKLLTDRWDSFDTLREFNGISGFSQPKESKYDYYCSGHSSTSLSIAVGSAKAISLSKEDKIPVALIGDGSMSAGMVYEALNELGDRKYPVIIILNDNEMSIAKPIGAISKFLSKAMAGKYYQKFKTSTEKILDKLPDSATYLAKRFEGSMKLITPGLLFEELGIEYIGPIDGHNLKELIQIFEIAKVLKKPVIIHTQTTKGKGYKKAEGQLEQWHGVGAFDLNSGKSLKKSSSVKNPTTIFSEKLLKLAEKNKKIVGLTAAMPTGTGLDKLIEKFPDRFWDVAIAEQHAVTSAGALAREGFKPYIAIYSTFLQRGFDQIIHDIALMDLPVVFAIDRGGLVGEDGETHQGIFDVSFLRIIPNLIIFAPRDNKSLEDCIEFSSTLKSPSAFRYPRGKFIEVDKEYPLQKFQLMQLQILDETDGDILFIGYGNGVNRAINTKKVLNKDDIGIVDLKFLVPLDKQGLIELSKKYKKWFIFSDNIKKGGVGSCLMEFLSDNDIFDIQLKSFEFEKSIIPHGDTEKVEELLQITSKQLAKKVL